MFKDGYEAYTGLHTDNDVTYVYDNGKKASCGLYEIDGEYYYSYWGGVLKTDGTYYVEATYCDLPVGTYTFDVDGKLINGIVEKDGVYTYYLNGKTASDGLYKVDGDYYFVKNNGVCVTDAWILLLHRLGWCSSYEPEVLCLGD